jgi:phosphatidylglycerol:prolipoprotein diacylglycerol transferase
MYPRLIHIYGPFWVQSYGLMIILGFLVFLFCTYYNKTRKSIINDELFFNALFLGLVSGVIGGRALYVLYEWNNLDSWLDIFLVWQGGFVVLGTILAVVLTLSVYLQWHKISVLAFLDVIAVYVPLMHAIARIGCFLAGCCYGALCHDCLGGITFTNPDGMAPLNVVLYPTQIYSCLASLFIFSNLFLLRNVLAKRGQLLTTFLSFECASRFFIDFYRGDRGNLTHFSFLNYDLYLSEIQIWVAVVFVISVLAFVGVSFNKTSINKKRS